MKTVLITGGSGIVGRHLCKKLKEKGFNVAILSRTNKQEADLTGYKWNIEKKEIDKKAIETSDYIIHLAGANIGDKRWSKKRKQLIIDSRVKSAQLIFEKIKKHNKNLKAFISASAIGFYGTTTSDKIYTEIDAPANDFLGKTCQLWEEAADRFKELGIRTVKIRTGVVLTIAGGVFPKMLTPVKLGLGSALGNGKQYIPWIHIDDLCEIYVKGIEDIEMQGAYNAVAPDNKTNREFTQVLARELNKPFWFPNVPAIILKLMFGEMSNIILQGSRVSADKIIAAGFNFKFPNIEGQ